MANWERRREAADARARTRWWFTQRRTSLRRHAASKAPSTYRRSSCARRLRRTSRASSIRNSISISQRRRWPSRTTPQPPISTPSPASSRPNFIYGILLFSVRHPHSSSKDKQTNKQYIIIFWTKQNNTKIPKLQHEFQNYFFEYRSVWFLLFKITLFVSLFLLFLVHPPPTPPPPHSRPPPTSPPSNKFIWLNINHKTTLRENSWRSIFAMCCPVCQSPLSSKRESDGKQQLTSPRILLQHQEHMILICISSFPQMISRPSVLVSNLIELHIAIKWLQQLKLSSIPVSPFQYSSPVVVDVSHYRLSHYSLLMFHL